MPTESTDSERAVAGPGLVSVGVPIYNGARYIGRALDSLLAQTYHPIEIIISDNASTDDSLAIVRDYASRFPNVSVSSNEANLGAEKNFRIVLEKARGEFFMWAAHDDIWAPTFVSKLVEALRARPDAMVAQSGFRRITDTGVDKGEFIYPDVYAMGNVHLAFRVALGLGGSYTIFFYGLFRRAFLSESFRNYTLFRSADRAYITELALGAKLTSVPEVLHTRQLRTNRQESKRVLRNFAAFMVRGGNSRLRLWRPASKMWLGSKVISPTKKPVVPALLAAFMVAEYRLDWKRAMYKVRRVVDAVVGTFSR